jgi:hypothetical protein
LVLLYALFASRRKAYTSTRLKRPKAQDLVHEHVVICIMPPWLPGQGAAPQGPGCRGTMEHEPPSTVQAATRNNISSLLERDVFFNWIHCVCDEPIIHILLFPLQIHGTLIQLLMNWYFLFHLLSMFFLWADKGGNKQSQRIDKENMATDLRIGSRRVFS